MPAKPQNADDDSVATLPRVTLDFNVPMWGVMGLIGSGVVIAATMYFQLARLADDVTELKATMKAGNAQTIQYAQEQALLKFRIEKLEDTRAR